MAAFAGMAAGAALVVDVLLGMTAVGWIGFELWRFHQEPDAIEMVEVVTPGLRTRILQWVAVCGVALVFNVIDGNDFWAWTVWVGAAAWPASIYVQRQLLERGKFLHPKVEAAVAGTGRGDRCGCGGAGRVRVGGGFVAPAGV